MKSVFAENLSQLRREKRYSQRQAAADLGISQALLSHYENGAREPKLEFVVKICDYYSVPADFILGRCKERCGGVSHLAHLIDEKVDSLQQLKTEEEKLIYEIKQITSNGNNHN